MVISTYLPSCCPAQRDARRRLPSRGSLGPRFPTFTGTLRRYDSLPARLGSLRSSLASRYLACFRGVRGVPQGLAAWWKPPGHARACGRPVPLSGNVARRQVVLPPSHVTPLHACPALSPRWCPRHAPYCAEDCCLPATGNRRRSPPSDLARIRLSTPLRLSGLDHTACLLATPGSIPPLAETHAGSLLTCWLGVRQVGLEPYGLAPTG